MSGVDFHMSVGGSLFCFKQKKAYEVSLSVVGSEMCVKDRNCLGTELEPGVWAWNWLGTALEPGVWAWNWLGTALEPGVRAWKSLGTAVKPRGLLYTSDAADDDDRKLLRSCPVT